jgi:hypothetical protein
MVMATASAAAAALLDNQQLQAAHAPLKISSHFTPLRMFLWVN